MRCALYVRVSTLDRRRSGEVTGQSVDAGRRQDPNLQLIPLREFAKQRGFQIVAEYVDFFSGSRDQRPGLDQLVAEMHRRRFDVVCVWKIDRLGRSSRHLAEFIDECHLLGVQFVSMTESYIDTTTPGGKFVYGVMGAIAELERSLDSERIRAGLANALRKGKTLGRPRRELDTEAIRLTYERIRSVRETAKLHGVGKRTVERILAGER